MLVTGGAGFIGSHVSDMLIANGHEVLIVDNLSSGKRSNIPKAADFMEMDVCSESLVDVVRQMQPGAIMHLAAQIDVRKSVEDPVFDAHVNVLGLVRLAQAAMVAGVEKIVFSSTGGAIYGEQDFFPADEHHPCRPVSFYGASKLCGEVYLDTFSRVFGLKWVALRYSNVYGPRQDPHGEAGVVAIFSGRLLHAQRPRIYGDGLQTRDYVFVTDVARANLMAVESDIQGVFNIGTGIETNVCELAALMSKIVGFNEKPEHLPAKAGEQMRSSIDAGKAHREMDWKPEVDLMTGLGKTLEYFRNHL